MRQAAHSLLNGKTDGHKRRGCARDGTAGQPGGHPSDGELLERVGRSDT